jgi:hypothetical protein
MEGFCRTCYSLQIDLIAASRCLYFPASTALYLINHSFHHQPKKMILTVFYCQNHGPPLEDTGGAHFGCSIDVSCHFILVMMMMNDDVMIDVAREGPTKTDILGENGNNHFLSVFSRMSTWLYSLDPAV